MSGTLDRFAKFIGLAAVASVLFLSPPAEGAGAAGRDVKRIDRKSVITPVLDHPIDANTNLIYAGTFQMAWNRMATEIIGERIILDRHLGLVDRLNGSLSGGECCGLGGVDPSMLLVMAGYGKDRIADRINEELERRFGSGVPEVDASFNDEDVILAYACLDKVSRFVHPFPCYDRPLVFGGSGGRAEVRAFGLGSREDTEDDDDLIRGQVEVLEYGDDGEFIIRLGTDDSGEELILASVKPRGSLLETCDEVEWRVAASEARPMGPTDRIIIPVLEVGIDESFTPLLGRYLLNDGFREYFVAAARQDVRFRLDNTGASIGSRGLFAVKKGGPVGKTLIFSKPFLLYLKRKGSDNPYFAMWVGNTTVMENVGS